MVKLDPSLLESARRAAINGEYNLLLGAGASLDALSPSGKKLPAAKKLSEMLAAEFSVPLEDDDLLWRIYDRAVTQTSEAAVYEWLRSIFFNTEPPIWMRQYANFRWETVWTLNIDDSFENSYELVRTEFSRALSVDSWDEYTPQRNDTLSVVHLHGTVTPESPKRLVFSLSEYQEAMVSRSAWPSIFRDTYGVKPFVIIGARLRDEPDIEKIIAGRRPFHTAPSFYVSPNISDAVASDLRNWNLIPVEMTAEEFLKKWSDITNTDLTETPRRDDEIALRFGSQFRELSTQRVAKPAAEHDFIGGDEPTWHDIVHKNYAETDWIRLGSTLAKRFGKSIPHTSLLLFTGSRLSGKSTGLLAIAREFRAQSWRIFLFDADERVDVRIALEFASDGKQLVLIFDGMADVAEDIEQILENARRAQLKVACIAVDNLYASAGILGRLRSNYLAEQRIRTISRTLTRADAARLVDHLHHAGRLGILERLRDRDRISHFVHEELFPSLASVEDAPGFGSRVEALATVLSGDDENRIVFLAAFAAKLDRTLLVIDAARMLQLESEEVIRLAKESPASDLIWTDGHRLRSRHRWMALNPAVKNLGTKAALTFLGDSLKRLSPRASRAALRERSPTTMFVGAAMIGRNLTEVFPREDLDSWYESLLSHFGTWSGRYWEQRAINLRHVDNQSASNLARAESYAQRAVSIVEDPYSYTTLGTILAARAAIATSDAASDVYDRAYDAFDKAISLDTNNLVTWIAFLRHSIPVLSRVAIDVSLTGLQERILDDWSAIYKSVSTVASASEDVRADLRNIKRRFDQEGFELAE